jgi:uncharacterized protein (DUF58 family)
MVSRIISIAVTLGRSLTLRGKGLIAVGLGLSLGAAMSGQRDLMRVAILLILLPIISALWVYRRGFRLGCKRQIGSSQFSVGDGTHVTVTIENLGPRTSSMLLRDVVPSALGASPHRVLTPLATGETTQLSYPLQATRRGSFLVGPLRLTALDPFGLVRLTRSFRSTSSILVVPRVIDLGAAHFAAQHLGHGEAARSSLAARGHDDVVPREYRSGDDLRRIHWRASARTGELMVRREEEPWAQHATLVVDTRARAHVVRDGESTLESALTIAASVGTLLLRHNFDVTVRTIDGQTISRHLSGRAGEQSLLRELAFVEPSLSPDIVASSLHGDFVIAVLTCSQRTGELVSSEAPRGTSDVGLAFILDTARVGDFDADTVDDVVRDCRAGFWRASPVSVRDTLLPDFPATWHAVARDFGTLAGPIAGHR